MFDMIRYLIENGNVDCNSADMNGWNSLMFACAYGDVEIVEYLLKNGADPNVRSYSGFTVLMDAAFMGDLEMVKCLIEKGNADIHLLNEGEDALSLARSRYHEEIEEYLLARMSDKIKSNE